MMRWSKKLLYRFAKGLGLFALSRHLTRKNLRILAYHGFALDDEASFRPQLFMDAGEFRWRMAYLARHNYPVLPLDEALELLWRQDLPRRGTVLTFDDGSYSFYQVALPVLRAHRFPGTIYLTTYYCLRQNPVFRNLVQYIFWKTTRRELALEGLGLPRAGTVSFSPRRVKQQFLWEIIHWAEEQLQEDGRAALGAELARRLDVDCAAILRKRCLSLMNPAEICEAARAGMNVELHTHRHVLPRDPAAAFAELQENGRIIESLTRRKPRHFCYPSGIYCDERRQALAAAGVLSATTCRRGLNDRHTPPLLLRRFLDGNDVSRIEFEAELSGFPELLKRLFTRLRRIALRIVRAYRQTPSAHSVPPPCGLAGHDPHESAHENPSMA